MLQNIEHGQHSKIMFRKLIIVLVCAMQVSVLPGNVLSIVMSKPNGFRYRSGQYIFLQCPTISSFEW